MNTLDCGEVSCEYCSKDKCIYMTTVDVLNKVKDEKDEIKDTMLKKIGETE